MPAKKFKTMKKRRTKFKKTCKSKKSGGGSSVKRKNIENQQKLKVALASLDSYLNKAEKNQIFTCRIDLLLISFTISFKFFFKEIQSETSLTLTISVSVEIMIFDRISRNRHDEF